MYRPPFASVFVAALGLLAGGPAGAAGEVPDFGFPLGFSVEKMDRSADPRRDFTRYAAGRWADALQIPADTVRISGLDLMSRRTDVRLRDTVEAAARAAAEAPRGSPTQQVGDLYAAGMDVERLGALGATPLQPVFERIGRITDRRGAAEEMARLTLLTNDIVVLGAGVTPDVHDRSKYVVIVGDGPLLLPNFEDYLKPESEPYRQAYLAYVGSTLALAGVPAAEAEAFAAKSLAMDVRIARVRQPLVEQQDPDKRFVGMRYDALKALTPAFDWDAHLAVLGLAPPQEVTAVEVRALAERNAILAELPLDDLKMLLKWEYLRQSLGGLSPAFQAQTLAFLRAFYGPSFELPPRSKQVFDTIAENVGHPLSRLYVEREFSPASRRAVEDMVGRVRAEFRARLQRNTWLAPATRAQAVAKLDKVVITVGYPDSWIDYGPVDVRAGDWFGSLQRINEFLARRQLARYGGPIREDGFSLPRETLPVVINAGYSPTRNAIEIPAAFLQPPIYDPAADAAVNYCAIGAVIGHELTHGFDSGGRRFDGEGRARNWWLPADAQRFTRETRKLVRQADAYQVLPGLHANGALAVTENLADVGGIAFAYAALQKHLRAHPQENRPIDGLTPPQRCFIAWAQLWADKSREGFLRQVTASDAHPPGAYRAYSASQHEPGFYKAFGIRRGDPMWLAPRDRVSIW